MQVATLFRESANLLGASNLDPPQAHHQTLQQQQQMQMQPGPELQLGHHMQHHYKM